MAINVGGPAYSAYNGVTYIADRYFVGGQISDWTWDIADVVNTKDDPVYLDERWGDFKYEIPMANGAYDVVLQFSEMNWNGVGERKITSVVEGVTMLRDFDIYQTVGNGSALDISFGNIQVRDGSLTIQMTASVDAGTLSGIVVKKAVVSTTNSTGGSDYSPPTAPTNVATSSITDRAINLKWSASSDNVGVAGYYVYRDGAPVGYVAGQATSYSDQGLKANTTYSYSVVAVDAAGNQAPSTVLPVKTYAIAGALTITWVPPAQRVSGAPVTSTDISGYVVRYKLKSASSYQTVSLPADVTTYTSPSLVGDYEFDLAAVDRVGVVGSYLRVQF